MGVLDDQDELRSNNDNHGDPVTPRYRSGKRPSEESRLQLQLDHPRYAQSMFRGFAILECFTPDRPVLGIKKIAKTLGMSPSTIHRYVVTMVALGYLEQTANRCYRLGLRVIDLGMSALSSGALGEQAESQLDDLRRRTGYTASLAVLDRTEIIYVKRMRSFKRSQYQLDHNIGVGSRSPAYCTAKGKVLLANLPTYVKGELIGEIELKRRGPNTITTKKALRTELKHVRDEEVAINNEELHEGLIAIAAGIYDGNREVVAAISLAAHTSMISLEQMVDALGPHLKSTADQISARLGYRRDDELPG